ncbi:hypothetical protein GCM10009678_37080 [Actinomadura kijaniata]|uniref:DNA primase n=1 Tax=Actinomadura namibiensis TaxID=182080 RepID=A0A7W3LZM2_ACTNM|nr:toprim domain-containing protein [Actinomadura namibiensis]MBA8957128.1 DNA primase [Actinomadura namibiensis]
MPGVIPTETAVLHDVAAHELARLRDGTLPWTWWLDKAARFGRFGFTNTLLVAAQWRAATDVRSYEEWRTAGRQVRRGEKGLRIIAAPDTPVSVFDLSQTAGLPPPTPRPADAARARDRLAALAARRFPHAPLPAGDLAALLHQLVHALRGDPLDPPGAGCHGPRRVEADSVAHLVMTRLGLTPPPLAFPPAVPWANAAFGDRVLRLTGVLHAHATDPSGDVLAAAHVFFRTRLAASWVPSYLVDRGFSRTVQRRWQIGHAPPGGRALTDHLRAAGHPEDALVATGLARRGRSGRLYDAFRDRMMFAIRAADGTIAGFIGRRSDRAPGPKYLNTPDTPLFHKGELLYGLHETRDRLARGARPVLVEGPLDAIAVNASSRDHAAVATCGLALTRAQVEALDATAADLAATGVLLALDGDPAGHAATRRAWEVLRHLPADAVLLPSGRDPAAVLAAHGRPAVRAALAGTVPLTDLVIDRALDGPADTPEQRLAALRTAVPLIAATRPPEYARHVARLAARLDLPPSLVTAALAEAVSPGGPSAPR